MVGGKSNTIKATKKGGNKSFLFLSWKKRGGGTKRPFVIRRVVIITTTRNLPIFISKIVF